MYHEDPLYHEDPWNQILIQSLKLLFAFTILYTHSSSLFFPFSINQRTIATVSNSNSIWVIDPLQLHMNHFINTLQYKNNIICLLKPIRIDNSHHIWFEKRKRNLTTWGKKNNGKSEKEKKKNQGPSCPSLCLSMILIIWQFWLNYPLMYWRNTKPDHWGSKPVISLAGPGQQPKSFTKQGRGWSSGKGLSFWLGYVMLMTGCNPQWLSMFLFFLFFFLVLVNQITMWSEIALLSTQYMYR